MEPERGEEPTAAVSLIPIRTFGDPVLKIAARDVETFDDALVRLAQDMFETMYEAPGAGLGDVGAVANPILSEMEGEQESDEGCLSVPGLFYPTTRFASVRVDGQDLEGSPIVLRGEDLLARIFQHETDHTNGTLYLDRLTRREHRRAMADIRERDPAEPRAGLFQRG
jgi:peptide deformylase